MKSVISIVLVVAGSALGAFVKAKYELTERISQVATEGRSLCRVGRGGASPTVEKIADRFVAMAGQRNLRATDVRVTVEPLDSNDGIAGQLQGTLATASGGKLKMEATKVTVQAHLSGKKWLWSVQRDISPSCVMQGALKRVDPP